MEIAQSMKGKVLSGNDEQFMKGIYTSQTFLVAVDYWFVNLNPVENIQPFFILQCQSVVC